MRELIAQADNRKLCTCDGDGRGPGRPCVVRAGERLGDLWRCARGLEAQVEQPAESDNACCGQYTDCTKACFERGVWSASHPRIAALEGLLREAKQAIYEFGVIHGAKPTLPDLIERIEAALGGK